MKDAEQSYQQLVRQLEELRSRVVELEAAEKEWNQTAETLRRNGRDRRSRDEPRAESVNLTVPFRRFPPAEKCKKSVPRSTHSLQVDRALVGRRLREHTKTGDE